jgi:DNA polymerase I-like protein with 3'-5' exonuclease and polymerase domains
LRPQPRFQKHQYTDLDISKLKPALNPILVDSVEGLGEVKEWLRTHKEFVLDYETNIPTVKNSFYRRRIRTLQLGDDQTQFVIDLWELAGRDTEKLIRGQGGFRRDNSLLHKYGRVKMFLDRGDESKKPTWCKPDRSIFQPLVDIMEPVLDSDEWLKIGHNLEFEYITSYWCLGIRPWNLYDTMRAEQLLWNGLQEGRSGYGLADVFPRYFGKRLSKEEQKSFDLFTELTDRQVYYAALDIRAPWRLRPPQFEELRNADLLWTHQIRCDAIPAFGDMIVNGMWNNPKAWQQIINENKRDLKLATAKLDKRFFNLPVTPIGRKIAPVPVEEVEALRAAIDALDLPTEREKVARDEKATINTLKSAAAVLRRRELSAIISEEREKRLAEKEALKPTYLAKKKLSTKGFAEDYATKDGEADINYGSADQVRAVLLENFPDVFTEKTLPGMDAGAVLPKFANMEGDGPDLIKDLIEYKKIGKQLETYGYRWITSKLEIAPETKKLKGFVDPDTGRIHPRFQQLGTDTGRPSCVDPNVLNLPQDERFRQAFQSRPGYDMVDKDCSGQELRNLTHYSQEEIWVDAFTNNKDVHSMSAQMFRREEWDNNALQDCGFFTRDFKKCACPVHKKIRNRYKAVTLGVIMGKMKWSLAIEMGFRDTTRIDESGIEVPYTAADQAGELIDEWFMRFPANKAAIERNQEDAYAAGEARTLSGFRRLVSQVRQDEGQSLAIKKYPVDKFPNAYYQRGGTLRIKDGWVRKALEGKVAAIKREAGNVYYQGTAACQMNIAMGCGFDENGEGFLWHKLREIEDKFGFQSAMLLSYVYDEFLVECREECSTLIGGVPDEDGVYRGGIVSDCIIRSGVHLGLSIPMESEGKVQKFWGK